MVQLELYIREPINFLRTVTLKNKHFANLIGKNDVMPEYQEILPDELNPYYRHARGEYILADDTTEVNGVPVSNRKLYSRFDEMIYIQSLDDQTQVPFTKEMLTKHPKTASLYRIPGAYYTKLCSAYPQYSDLIKAIVYPIKESIWCPRHQKYERIEDADNFSIFGYDEEMFQVNERTSIYTALESMLEMVRERWDVAEFNYEDMYPIVHQGILWNLMYLCILGQRILNIRTSRVHEFHLWNYLGSKGIGDYRDVLSLNQALFLYRNINYLLKNKGTQRNFSILIGTLLKPMNLALYSKSIIQDVTRETREPGTKSEADTIDIVPQKKLVLTGNSINSSFANTCKPYPQILSNRAGDEDIIEQAECLVNNKKHVDYGKPVDIVQRILNQYHMGDGYTHVEEVNTGTVETTSITYDKERLSYLEYQDEDAFKMSTTGQDYKFAVTPHTFLTSKAHEINRILTSTLYNQVYAKFVTESILYRASEGDLDFSITLIPPDTKVPIALDGPEALAVILYCACREVGIVLTEPPHEADLMWPYKKEFPDIPEIFYYQGHKRYTKSYLTDYGFTDMVPYPDHFISAEDMGTKIDDQAINFINNFWEIHRSSSSIHMEILAKVYMMRCVKGWVTLDLTEGQKYKKFFHGIEGLEDVIEQYDNSVDPPLAYSKFFDALMKQFYPVNSQYLLESDISLGYKYRRIKQLFVEMCSYNVTFFDHIEGMTHVSHTFWHSTFDVQKNILVGMFEYLWCDPKDRWRIVQTCQLPFELLFHMHIHGPYDFVYRFRFGLCDMLHIGLVHELWMRFVHCGCEVEMTGKLLPKWERRDLSITDALSIELEDDDSNDISKEEQSRYSSAYLEYKEDGSRVKTYKPYPQHHEHTGVLVTHMSMDAATWITTGSVTPVYDKIGSVTEVIEERVHKYDEIPDYQIHKLKNRVLFVKVNHPYIEERK